MSEEQLTPEEEEQLEELKQMVGGNAPLREENLGIFNFFNKVLKAKDTIKVSNLDDQEVPSVRMLRSTAAYADIMGLELVSAFLAKEAEITLGSALSKKGFLIESAITSKRENRVRTKTGGGKKGWTLFGKKEGEMD